MKEAEVIEQGNTDKNTQKSWKILVSIGLDEEWWEHYVLCAECESDINTHSAVPERRLKM